MGRTLETRHTMYNPKGTSGARKLKLISATSFRTPASSPITEIMQDPQPVCLGFSKRLNITGEETDASNNGLTTLSQAEAAIDRKYKPQSFRG